MFIEHNVFIGLRDVALDNKVTNTAMLSYLEDAGGVHSNVVHFGLNEIPETKRSWVLLDWKIRIDKRPKYGDNIIIKTWARGIDRLYALRDFEILDENRNVLGVATSRWVLVDTEKKKITRIDENVAKMYTIENVSAFEEENFDKLKEPKIFINTVLFDINRSLIDVNNHVHNIYFMDIANEVLPMDIYKNKEFNNIRMMYKKEIKLNEKVKVFYSFENNEYTIVIKSEDEKDLHAIIVLS